MATFTANDHDIPTVDPVEQWQADAVLALIEARGEPDHLVSMLGLDGAVNVPVGHLRGSARKRKAFEDGVREEGA